MSKVKLTSSQSPVTALRQAFVLIVGFIFQFFGSIKYRGPELSGLLSKSPFGLTGVMA